MGSINITFQVGSDLDRPEFENALLKEAFKNVEPKGYMTGSWKSRNLTINLYERKLTVQGRYTDEGISILQKIVETKGLSLDPKNQEKFNSFFPKMNAILCPECQRAFYVCKGEVSDGAGLEIRFRGECGHELSTSPPFKMMNTRIMPDMNILIGNVLSKLIELGFFRKFEIVVTDFMLDWIDRFLGERRKKGASREIENLRKLSDNNDINLLVIPIPEEGKDITEDNFEEKEDKVILRAAMITNSVLMTKDSTFKSRAITEKRPVIFLPSKFDSKLKHAKEVRVG